MSPSHIPKPTFLGFCCRTQKGRTPALPLLAALCLSAAPHKLITCWPLQGPVVFAGASKFNHCGSFLEVCCVFQHTAILGRRTSTPFLRRFNSCVLCAAFPSSGPCCVRFGSSVHPLGAARPLHIRCLPPHRQVHGSARRHPPSHIHLLHFLPHAPPAQSPLHLLARHWLRRRADRVLHHQPHPARHGARLLEFFRLRGTPQRCWRGWSWEQACGGWPAYLALAIPSCAMIW